MNNLKLLENRKNEVLKKVSCDILGYRKRINKTIQLSSAITYNICWCKNLTTFQICTFNLFQTSKTSSLVKKA